MKRRIGGFNDSGDGGAPRVSSWMVVDLGNGLGGGLRNGLSSGLLIFLFLIYIFGEGTVLLKILVF